MNLASVISVHDFVEKSRANGPGIRAVLWVQGCSFCCLGCWNPDSLVVDRRNLTPVAELVERIAAIDGIDGITFSGGEPFGHAAQLAELAQLLRQRRGENFTVVSYSGHTLRGIQRFAAAGSAGFAEFLGEIDLLVDGRYHMQRRSIGLPLRGSSNQQLHFLTQRIKPEEVGAAIAEFTLGDTGEVTQTGYLGQPGGLEATLAELARIRPTTMLP